MKDLLIGNITRYTPDKIHNWVQSAKRHFKGEILVIVYDVPEETIEYLKANNITVVNTQATGLHIVVQRFLDIYSYLSSNPDYRYVIVTDVKDVIFQRDPIQYITENYTQYEDRIIVGSEGINYVDEEWGNNNLATCYPHLYEINKNTEIFNAGTFAGEAIYVRDLCFNVFNLSLIGVQHDPQPDQAAFNIILNTVPWEDVTYYNSLQEAWAAQLGTTLDPKIKDKYASKLLYKSPVIKDNRVYTHDGILYCIVHQYDRIPGLEIEYL